MDSPSVSVRDVQPGRAGSPDSRPRADGTRPRAPAAAGRTTLCSPPTLRHVEGRTFRSADVAAGAKELITVSTVTGPPVVVGIDPSDASVAALVWAAEEAAAHHA